MKILALDSTAVSASCALVENDRIIFEYTVTAGLNHSETLLPMIEHGLKISGVSFDEIEMIAISNGPGSFTGVRIGVSLVKGLAFGKNIKCVGVSTLEALAYNLKGFCGVICPCMDARRNQVYNALFMSDGESITRITEDRALSVEELEKEIKEYTAKGENVYLCGDGYYLVKNNVCSIVQNTPARLINQNACSVAFLAEKIYKSSPNADYSDTNLKPTYLRLPQAERERLEKLSSENNVDIKEV